MPKLDKFSGIARPVALNLQRKQKHVSLIFRKNQIVSVGTNEFKTHPMAKQYGYRYDEVHSELDALIRYKGPKDNLKLYNFRFNRFGQMRMSRPCSKCLPWCVAVFDEIWYTTNKGIYLLDKEKINV